MSSASRSSANTLDAERADRISRLAGLERVATIRQGSHGPTSQFNPTGAYSQQHPQGYFDNAGAAPGKERSTVGSASATGSVGGRTTWASGSDVYDPDKMSEDQDDGVSSAGLSDEGNASLVGFGEGASSTVSGPISNPGRTNLGSLGRTNSGVGSSSAGRGALVPMDSSSPMQGVQTEKSKMTGRETSDRIVQERLNDDRMADVRSSRGPDEGREF